MRRRDVFVLLAAAAALPPLAAAAPRPRRFTIGVLVARSAGSRQFWSGFRQALRELGYVEGQNVHFEYRSDDGEEARLPALAAELVRLKPDVIVTWFTPAGFAAKRATHDIPIVLGSAGNPVETGLVASLARPGGNVTGIAGVGADLAGKLVELVREMLPGAHRIVALANAPDPFSKPFVGKIRQAGKATGVAIEPVMLQGSGQLESAFAAMAKDRPGAIIVQPTLGSAGPAQLALQYRIAAVSLIRDFSEAGGLMSYSTVFASVYRRTARFVDKILKGAKPADLPVEEPTKFDLVINMKTANELGLTIPQSFLRRADEVIE